MLNWIMKLIPSEYKWSVGIKKAAWTVAKTTVAFIAASKLGKELKPEDLTKMTEIGTLVLVGGMKIAHDWARLRFPNAKWL